VHQSNEPGENQPGTQEKHSHIFRLHCRLLDGLASILRPGLRFQSMPSDCRRPIGGSPLRAIYRHGPGA